MICLALDTCTNWGRFTLARGADVLVDRPHNVTGSYADSLLPLLDGMLEEAGLARADLDALAVARGPGSFTGVRIGVATVKGLAFGLGVPLYAVSTLEAMAAAMLLERPDRDWAVPSLDARRGELFAGVYRRRGAWVEVVAPPASLPMDAWWERVLEMAPDPEAPVYADSGTSLLLGAGETLRPELRARGDATLRCWSAAHPATAKALAWVVASGQAPFAPVHPFTLTPSYLRVSDAEVKRGLDLTPGGADAGEAPVEDRRPQAGS